MCKELNNNELVMIKGGSISATMINAITKTVNTLFTLGRAVGSAIRRGRSGKMCGA